MKRIAFGIAACTLSISLTARAGDETAIDLDSLDDSPKAAASAETEPLLPVTVPSEIESKPAWMLATLGVLLPLAAMMVPVGRKKSSAKKPSPETKASSKKECYS